LLLLAVGGVMAGLIVFIVAVAALAVGALLIAAIIKEI
jgi:hypothetical protein